MNENGDSPGWWPGRGARGRPPAAVWAGRGSLPCGEGVSGCVSWARALPPCPVGLPQAWGLAGGAPSPPASPEPRGACSPEDLGPQPPQRALVRNVSPDVGRGRGPRGLIAPMTHCVPSLLPTWGGRAVSLPGPPEAGGRVLLTRTQGVT